MRFSVIVPVYNVADYLPKCMDSLLAQRCGDWELILVDDGSTDGRCPGLCDGYEAQYPQLVRTIHQPNGGLGAARNTGLAAARGDYVFFVDSDDWLTPDALEKLSREIDATQADMYIFSFRYVEEDGSQYSPTPSAPILEPTSLAETPSLLLDPPMACTRICRRSLFTEGKITFPGRVWYEDLCTTPKLLLGAQSVIRLEDELYCYLQRAGSIMRSSNLQRNLEILNAVETVRSFFLQQGAMDRYGDWLCLLSLQHLMDAARRVLMVDPRADYLPRFMDYMKTNYPNYRNNPLLPGLGKKKLLLLRLLENKQYRLARILFRAASKLK